MADRRDIVPGQPHEIAARNRGLTTLDIGEVFTQEDVVIGRFKQEKIPGIVEQLLHGEARDFAGRLAQVRAASASTAVVYLEGMKETVKVTVQNIVNNRIVASNAQLEAEVSKITTDLLRISEANVIHMLDTYLITVGEITQRAASLSGPMLQAQLDGAERAVTGSQKRVRDSYERLAERLDTLLEKWA